ncbi:MAG: type II CRISPR-associated endonuclease Cas1 [Lachnospiraceae bacterium]|nr:type II CRISPR-associated endonuclease Cas1 [Lachnospiraceae bacterium]
MSWRTVIISKQAKLDYKMGYMVVRGEETKRILIDEISTLVVENPMVSFTGCLIEMLVAKKVKTIFCDSQHNPAAELIPQHGSHDSTAKIRSQIQWSVKAKEAIWQEIVTDKIQKQAELLEEQHRDKETKLLRAYAEQVELFDKSNREGHAAKVYFNALFGMDFSRSKDNPINAALNYGYSIILSAFNRSIAAYGYLTQLGIFHDNMFNSFNLGCDMMEPFRPLVDRMVIELLPEKFDKEEKHEMWKVMDQRIRIAGSKQLVSNAINIYAKSILDALNDDDLSLMTTYQVLGREE